MNKEEFLARLGEALSGLPREDAEERLAFYGEMIDDRVECGLSEEDAVAEIGPVDEIVSHIVAEIPLPRLVREKVRPDRRLRAWEVVLLILGSPVWLPLLIAAFAVVLSVYIVIWAVIVSLWAADVSLAAGALGGAGAGILSLCQGHGIPGHAVIGTGMALAGLCIFLFFGCKAASKGALILTGKIALGIKSLVLRKERVR